MGRIQSLLGCLKVRPVSQHVLGAELLILLENLIDIDAFSRVLVLLLVLIIVFLLVVLCYYYLDVI